MKNKKRLILIILLCLFLQIISIPAIVFVIKVAINIGGKMPLNNIILWINSNGFELSLNEFITLNIYFMQALITVVFSYILWRTSEKSNDIALELQKSEISREKSHIKEATMIVYFDLKLGFDNLRKLYEGMVLNNKKIIPKRIFLNQEWIKNVAILKDELNNQDIKDLYEIYNDLSTIKDLLEEKENEELKIEISRVVELILDKSYLEYAKVGIEINDIESILNLKYQNLFERLKWILYVSTNLEFEHVKIDDEVLIKNDSKEIWIAGTEKISDLNGIFKIYNDNNRIRYYGQFVDGNLKNGNRYEYYNENDYIEILYDDGQYKKVKLFLKEEFYMKASFVNNKFSEGYKKTFYKNGKLEYVGNYIGTKYHGEGVKYNTYGSIEDGVFSDGRFIKGIIRNVLYEDTESGYSWEAEQRQIEECQSDSYIEYQEQLCNEEDKKHIIGTMTFCDMKLENNEYTIVKKIVKDKYDKDFELI